VTDSSTLTNDLPPLISTAKVDDTKRINRVGIFDLDIMAEELSTVSSLISTETFDNDEALCRMDTYFLSSNINLVGDIIVPQNINSTNVQPNETGSSIVYFGEDELDIAKKYYNMQLKLTAVDHDKKVKAELSSIFETPHYKSPEARSIIVHAAKFTLSEIMLKIYTTYHSPLSRLLFSYLEHSDVKTMIEIFHWMKPLMNYSFPLRLPELSLFPTMSSRRRLRIIVQSIQETPEHRPDASRFLDLISLSTCEYCACDITSGYCTMALFFKRLCPKCLKQHIIEISPNDGARLFRRQHFHGARNRIHLPADHTMLVSRLYCLKKQFTDYRNKNHGGPLRSQLLYYLGYPVVMPHDAKVFSEWCGAVEPILLHWCNEAHEINTDESMG
jgi:hypothetical protein